MTISTSALEQRKGEKIAIRRKEDLPTEKRGIHCPLAQPGEESHAASAEKKENEREIENGGK